MAEDGMQRASNMLKVGLRYEDMSDYMCEVTQFQVSATILSRPDSKQNLNLNACNIIVAVENLFLSQ